MSKIIVLFNLKAEVSVEAYEAWALATDIPTVNGLKSVDAFDVFRTSGLLGGGEAPYQYVEIIDVPDLAALGEDVATEVMQKVSAEFQELADNPLFMVTQSLVNL